MIDQHRFHNALRVLMSIDQHEMVAAGVEGMRSAAMWEQFRENPYRFCIHCDSGSDTMTNIWGIVEGRMRPRGSVAA